MKSKFKMYREENGKPVLDLEVKRDGEVFDVKENVNKLDKNGLTLDQLNSAMKKIGVDEEQFIDGISGDEVIVNDNLLEEFQDFFEFTSDVMDNIKLIEE